VARLVGSPLHVLSKMDDLVAQRRRFRGGSDAGAA
jgi:hypothetical protein